MGWGRGRVEVQVFDFGEEVLTALEELLGCGVFCEVDVYGGGVVGLREGVHGSFGGLGLGYFTWLWGF
jgi:hypothetical protein